jgi:hypothetical protein
MGEEGQAHQQGAQGENIRILVATMNELDLL